MQWRLVYTDCRRQKSSQQGAKPDLSGCIFDGVAVKSAFALLSTKVTKHIPPQPSPGGLALAGIYFGTVVCADQIGEINDEPCDLTESRLEEENDEQEIFAGAVNG